MFLQWLYKPERIGSNGLRKEKEKRKQYCPGGDRGDQPDFAGGLAPFAYLQTEPLFSADFPVVLAVGGGGGAAALQQEHKQRL